MVKEATGGSRREKIKLIEKNINISSKRKIDIFREGKREVKQKTGKGNRTLDLVLYSCALMASVHVEFCLKKLSFYRINCTD